MTTLNDSFVARLPIMLGIIRAKLSDDESRQNALAWAFDHYRRHYLDVDDDDSLARRAAASGALTAMPDDGLPGRAFGAPPRCSVRTTSGLPCDPVDYRDAADCCADNGGPDWRIADIPETLRPVARGLVEGLSCAEIARRGNYSLSTITRYKARLRLWAMGEPCGPESV